MRWDKNYKRGNEEKSKRLPVWFSEEVTIVYRKESEYK